jgi:hypothetical protein
MGILDIVALAIGVLAAAFGVFVLLKIKPKTEKKPKIKKVKKAKKEKSKTFDVSLEKEATTARPKKKGLFGKPNQKPELAINVLDESDKSKASTEIDLDAWEQNK